MADPDTEAERATEKILVERLRAGDEAAFSQLVRDLGPVMLRVARMHARDKALADEIVQEAWLAVLNGIDKFEGRSSLKTWILRIVSNRAKTRAQREGRTVPFAALARADATIGEPAVDSDRFQGADAEQWPFHWAVPPTSWPAERIEARETLGVVKDAIAGLPETQREVIRLRDIEGYSAEDVAGILEISDGNQRVLLHRARSKVRAALESYLMPPEMAT